MPKYNAQRKLRLVVSEADLLTVLAQRRLLAGIRKQAREAEAVLEQQERAIMNLLRAGATVEGRRSAAIETQDGPCRPKYQELWVEHMTNYHNVTEAMALEVARGRYPPKAVESLAIGEPPQTLE